MFFRILLLVVLFWGTISTNAQVNQSEYTENVPVFSESEILDTNNYTTLVTLNQPATIQYGTISSLSEALDGIEWKTTSRSFQTIEGGLIKKNNSITYDLGTSNYSGHLTTTYFYNLEGKISEILYHKLYRHYYSYDNNGNLIEILKKDITGSYDIDREIYNYDLNNFLLEIIKKNWDGSAWINSTRSLNTNNVIGKPTEQLQQAWNGTWVDVSKSIYNYDANNNLIEVIRQRIVSANWVNFTRSLYSYNVNTLLITESISQNWLLNQWNYNKKFEYYYNQDQDLIEVKIYSYSNNNWFFDQRSTRTYSSENAMAVVTPNKGQVFNPNSEILVNWITLNVPNIDISFSSDGGVNWISIATGIPDTGDYEFIWTDYPLGMEYGKIKVADSQNPDNYSISYGDFRSNVFSEYDFLTHNTNSIQFSAFNNGYLGRNRNLQQQLGIGFKFNGLANTLYTGGVIISTPSVIANGMVGSFHIGDFTNNSPMLNFTANEIFNQISYTNIIDSNAPIPSGLKIAQQTSTRLNDDYVFVTYNVFNSTSETIDNVFVGIFADWDIESYDTNLGGVDSTNKIIYQYQQNASLDNNYYGIGCLSAFSGAKVAGLFDGSSREAVLSFITNNIYGDITQVDDYRSFIGSGPFTINPNERVIAGFVVLAASDISNLVNRALEAQELWNSGFSTTIVTGLTAGTTAGGQTLEVLSNEGFSIGDVIKINPGGQNEETNTIIGFGSLLLQAPLQFNHFAGEMIEALVTTSIEEKFENIPNEYDLMQNYPNPFNPTTTIKYSIPNSVMVKLIIYDLLGREVKTLVNDFQQSGEHSIQFDGGTLSSGVYFYSLKAGDFTQTKKLVLMK